jgi:hypothetical protein
MITGEWGKERLCHMDVRYKFIKYWVEQGFIGVNYINLENQEADLVTKPLPFISFSKLKNEIGMIEVNWLYSGYIYDSSLVEQLSLCHVQYSTTDQIFCIRQILEKKWEYNKTVYQLFVDFKKAYDSVRREVLYNILIRVWGTHETS